MENSTLLVAKAKEGSREAYGRLYEQLYSQMYRYALYTLGNPEDAEDAVAETFLEGYKGIGNLRDPGAFNSWMYSILSVRCKRKIKKYVDQRTYGIADDISEISNRVSVDTSDVEIDRLDLAQALSNLSVSERQVVVLASLEGYKIREIATILDCPMGTVSAKLHRALKKMRKDLERG